MSAATASKPLDPWSGMGQIPRSAWRSVRSRALWHRRDPAGGRGSLVGAVKHRLGHAFGRDNRA